MANVRPGPPIPQQEPGPKRAIPLRTLILIMIAAGVGIASDHFPATLTPLAVALATFTSLDRHVQ